MQNPVSLNAGERKFELIASIMSPYNPTMERMVFLNLQKFKKCLL